MEATVDDVDWAFGDSTLLYNPTKRFPVDELLALAREHARCPGLVHRGLRRGMDPEAVARLFGLESVGDDSGGCSGSGSTAGSAAAGGTEGGSVQDQGPAGYFTFTVEESDELEYVLVGTADEVERERRQEADAEAVLEAGLEDADAEVAARKARANDGYLRPVEELMDLDEDAAITARQSDLADEDETNRIPSRGIRLHVSS